MGYYWFEDPLAEFDIYNYVKLRQKLDIPIMATEHTPGQVELYVPWLTERATDYLRGDVAIKGGLTSVIKTAHLAEAFGMRYEIHHGGNSLNNVANLHALMAIRNSEMFEVIQPEHAQKYGLVRDIEVDAEGMVQSTCRPRPWRRDRLRSHRAQEDRRAAVRGKREVSVMAEPQARFPAVFMRGGSSKGVFFHRRDLPEDRALWDPIFLAAIGSPDTYGRQLDGMGGGYSSVSKIVVMAPSARTDADVDYTFGQVAVGRPEVHYRTTCGNLMAAAAHFALDEGLVVARDGGATVRIFDTNTRKSVVARFATEGRLAAVEGDFAVVGVSGSGAPVRLDFLDPGGAGTGRLLPSGAPCDVFDVPGLGRVDVSLVDAANPCAFVRAEQFGVQGSELPADLNADTMLVTRLEQIRRQAGVIMGFGPTPESVAPKNSPKVALVGRPQDCALSDGRTSSADAMSLAVRLLTFGSFHPALPLTNAMCVASAALIAGTVVHDLVKLDPASPRRILVGTPAGAIPVEADVMRDNSEIGWRVRSATVFNTARRLMEGHVLVPSSCLPGRRLTLGCSEHHLQ